MSGGPGSILDDIPDWAHSAPQRQQLPANKTQATGVSLLIIADLTSLLRREKVTVKLVVLLAETTPWLSSRLDLLGTLCVKIELSLEREPKRCNECKIGQVSS